MARLRWFCPLVLAVQLVFTISYTNGFDFQLESPVQKLAINLFRDLSNKTYLIETLGKELSQGFETMPHVELANIYRNYTQLQLSTLETELDQHSHFIYSPIIDETKQAKKDFEQACQKYEKNENLKELEQSFMQIGNKVMGLQKMVLRIINAKLETRLSLEHRNEAPFIKVVYKTFKVLYQVGIIPPVSKILPIRYRSEDNDDADRYVNQVYLLTNALSSLSTIWSPFDNAVRQNVQNLQKLVSQMRNIYQLNMMSIRPNQYLNTGNIYPFQYEAMLRLVNLLSVTPNNAARTYNVNPMVVLLRSWVNFFNGGNLFTALMGGSGNQPLRRPRYDPARLRRLIQLLQEKEQSQLQIIEQTRNRVALEKLIQTQNKQQQQIDTILQSLANRTLPGGGDPSTTTSRPPALSTLWPLPPLPNRPFPPARPTDILKQLKEQRRNLNELLKELQKPIKSPSSPTFGPSIGDNLGGIIGGNLPSLPNRYPPLGDIIGGSTSRPLSPPSPPQWNPTSQDLAQAQQTLLGIMKTVTPMMNTLVQSGLVAAPKIDQSKYKLLDILNSVNNRELDTDDDNMVISEVKRLGNLCEKFDNVLGDIIGDVETNVNNS